MPEMFSVAGKIYVLFILDVLCIFQVASSLEPITTLPLESRLRCEICGGILNNVNVVKKVPTRVFRNDFI